MINYRIDDLGEMLSQLRADGVEVIRGPESHENGRFTWIMDPDGNKVELWAEDLGRQEQGCLTDFLQERELARGWTYQ
jgi:catechol-2,3-dioxygenase